MHKPIYSEVQSFELIQVDQKIKSDLIYTLNSLRKKTHLIKYEYGGLFDLVLDNFKEHSKETELPDHEKYDWSALPKSESKFRSEIIYLCRPDKKPMRKYYDSEFHSKLINIVKLKRFIYRSSYFPEIIAYTYGEYSGNRIIKPFKILEHDWERIYTGWSYYDPNSLSWSCKRCSMKGMSPYSEKRAVIPSDLLTCGEVIIKDILL